jgi:hypothetical protein
MDLSYFGTTTDEMVGSILKGADIPSLASSGQGMSITHSTMAFTHQHAHTIQIMQIQSYHGELERATKSMTTTHNETQHGLILRADIDGKETPAL